MLDAPSPREVAEAQLITGLIGAQERWSVA
jgi:hypothetical protein